MIGIESTNGDSTAIELRSWLEAHEWQPGRLIDWMQGYELPTSPFEDQPYLFFLRSLPGGVERTKLARELARRVGKALAARPDEQPRANRPNQVLYNLFMLAGNLRCPEELAGPLQQVLARGELTGNWLGVDLRECLRAAVQANRREYPLEPAEPQEPDCDPSAWRGVFAPQHRRKVLFSVPVQLRASELPRRKSHTGINLRRLDQKEDD